MLGHCNGCSKEGHICEIGHNRNVLDLLNPKRIDASLSLYYGWIIIAVALVSMAFWLGIRSSFSVFYVVLLEDFPWNRGGSAGVQPMALITYTILAPLVGGLIDRFGPRRVAVLGILVLALGLMLCSTIDTLVQFYLLLWCGDGKGDYLHWYNHLFCDPGPLV